MRYCFGLGLTLLAASAAAETTCITIPDQGWHVTIDAPAPSTIEGGTQGSRFRYTANDPFTKTTYSINTEPFSEKTHVACREMVLSRAKNRPVESKEEKVKTFETAAFAGHRSKYELKVQGQTHSMATAHAFFVEKERCVDLHVSRFPYSDEALEEVEAIVRTLKVVRN